MMSVHVQLGVSDLRVTIFGVYGRNFRHGRVLTKGQTLLEEYYKVSIIIIIILD